MIKITFGPVSDRHGYTRNVFCNGQLVGEVVKVTYPSPHHFDYRFVPYVKMLVPARARKFADLAGRIVERNPLI